jgi:hypothetical protein
VDNPFVLIGELLVAFWPVVVIGVVVVVVFVGGPLLGCVVFAIAGAAGARVAPSDETQDVDVTEFFGERTTASATATAGRNDSI